MSLGLSREALAQRRRYVQAGDADRIMRGEWRSVWREKMGLAEGDDLSGELRVQMGLYTEPFNLAWCEKQTGRAITYYSGSKMLIGTWADLHRDHTSKCEWSEHELQVSKAYPWMACNLDGMTTTARGDRCVIDAKHVGRADDPMILRYTAAGTHQATVMECDFWALSVFIGNSKWEYIEQEIDPLYQADLIARTREFWGYVERKEEPEDRTAPVAPPKPQPRLRELHVPTHEDQVYEALLRQNNWLGEALTEARVIANTDGAAKRHAIARKTFAERVPVDVGLVEWGLFKAKRDKSGALRISVGKATDDDV